MSERRSSIQYWNFLREDSSLKGAISFKMKERNLSHTDLAELINVSSFKIKNYLNEKTPNLNNYEIVKLAKALGMELSIEITIDNEVNGLP